MLHPLIIDNIDVLCCQNQCTSMVPVINVFALQRTYFKSTINKLKQSKCKEFP